MWPWKPEASTLVLGVLWLQRGEGMRQVSAVTVASNEIMSQSFTLITCRQRFSSNVSASWKRIFYLTSLVHIMVVVWLSGNVVGQINEVTLRRAGLMLRWVTVRRVYCLGVQPSHPGQLSLVIPPWVDEMSTSGSQ